MIQTPRRDVVVCLAVMVLGVCARRRPAWLRPGAAVLGSCRRAAMGTLRCSAPGVCASFSPVFSTSSSSSGCLGLYLVVLVATAYMRMLLCATAISVF
jgi:hypothetical protein